MSSRRTRARERALQALYQIDVAAEGIDEALAAFWKSFEPVEQRGARAGGGAGPGRGRRTAARWTRPIEEASSNWRLDRMARVDRNVLRLAVYELLRTDVPVKVVINEAIELGKKFGSESSGAFVNGVLDKVAAGLAPERRGV